MENLSPHNVFNSVQKQPIQSTISIFWNGHNFPYIIRFPYHHGNIILFRKKFSLARKLANWFKKSVDFSLVVFFSIRSLIPSSDLIDLRIDAFHFKILNHKKLILMNHTFGIARLLDFKHHG